ncbi:hypothetical protein HDU81_000851 [Chytriomyces hyalinus]|nr:hypothetical protein HDU81_000851 [Chytriomyces hyalinus]
MQLALVASNELLIAETRLSSRIQTGGGGSGDTFHSQQTLSRGLDPRVRSPSPNATLHRDDELNFAPLPDFVRNQFSLQDIPVNAVERGCEVVDDAELAILERIAAERTERDRAMNEKLHAEAMLKWRQDAHLRPRLEDEEETAGVAVLSTAAGRVVGGGGVSYEQGRPIKSRQRQRYEMDLTDEELHALEQLAWHKVALDRSLLQTDHDDIVAELRREMLQERRTAEQATRTQPVAPADFVGDVVQGSGTGNEGPVVGVVALGTDGTDGRHETGLGRNLDQTSHTASSALPQINSIEATANSSSIAATDQRTTQMQMLFRQQQMQRIHQLYESVITRQTPTSIIATSSTSSRGDAYAGEIFGAAPYGELSAAPPMVASSSDPFQQLIERQMTYSIAANPYAHLLTKESPETGGANYLGGHQPPTAAAGATTSPAILSPAQPDSIPSTSAWARTVLLHFGPSESESESLMEAASPSHIYSDNRGNEGT